MTTATSTTHIPAERGGWLGRGLRRVFDGLVEAQTRVAERRIMHELRNLDDETLRRVGFSPKEIASLRAGGHVSFPA